ncbi:MAG: helix-turn-helix transcriptional regulator [Peptococcaceae bacterium]|nr:helix-turn-helix transcriptional regulator [Peptococcaceae bacterium]
MDCRKTGQLICRLRKEKGMTQKQLAELLMLSPKTVSKWECGVSQS